MSAGNLRYYGLGIYGGLVALWTGLDKIALDDTVAVALLAPIALLIGADYVKHKSDNKA
ncbi:MAG: hypothetical protein HOJ33_04110 [Gammaproteobacteria bacterium]|jgi:hypothetical protein|nr:hypothetical protein [Gammaproteobacteria bacterium]|tara:strand:+ start:426 stop:602 length:177 start_codon:yes stop_codon:yes gene_type:complete